MEEKVIKQVKTSCPFPLLIYKVNIKYNEVRKASGIAFILLELIQKNGVSNEKISDILLRFGIPADLHYIFGQEIAGLLNSQILSCVYPIQSVSNPKYFNEIKINEIALTLKGQKMFKEGAIPTGAEKVKVKDIYFSPVTRKFDVQSLQSYAALSSSYLGEEFLDKVTIDISGMEDYLNANLTKVGLKAEERIVSFEITEEQKMQTRREEGMSIMIRPSGVEFAFDTSDETAFFYQYYSSKLMTEGLLMKNNYKFVNANNEVVMVPSISIDELTNVSNIYIPSDIKKQANRPCKLFINKGNLGLERGDNVISIDGDNALALIKLIDNNTEFALIDMAGCKYYCPVNVSMPCKKFGDIFEMQLLVENVLPRTAFTSLIQKVFEMYLNKAFDNESGIVISFIVKVLDDSNYYNQYVDKRLDELKNVDDKIDLLLKLNYAFSKDDKWTAVFENYAETLFTQSVEEVRLDNMIYKNTVLSPLVKAIGMSDETYIKKFSSIVVLSEQAELVYQALEAAEFGLKQILGVVNVVKQYMVDVLDNQKLVSDTALSHMFRPVQYNLWKLNDMLGIENELEYSIRDDYNVDDFFNTYSTLLSSYKPVEQYSVYAKDEFDILKQYFVIYDRLQELLSIEKTASYHPDNITKKYVDELISRGKYKEAISDLAVKLQYDLRVLLDADDTISANDLINSAYSEKIIDKNAQHFLHELRMCRNSFQHPEKKQRPFTKDDIENWKETVFSINGGKK